MGHGWRCRWTSLWTSSRWSYAPAAACVGCCTAPGPRPGRITLTRPMLCALSGHQSAAPRPLTLQLLLMAVRLAWCRQMVAVLALAVLPLPFAHIAPPPPPRLEWVQSWQAHSPLAPWPAPDAQLGGPSLVRPAPLKCCTWVQSCQAHSFLAPFSALGAPVQWG